MLTTIKNKKTLPTGSRTSTVAVNPSVYRDIRGDLAAGVTAFLKIEEPTETIVAAHIGMTPTEARDLAKRLVEAADRADAMLAE